MFKFFRKLFKKSPRKKGRRLAIAALMAFDAPQDAEKFREIRKDLENVIQRRDFISTLFIKQFQDKMAKELKVNPLLFSLVFSELLTFVDPEEPEGQEELFEFLQGIVDAINIVY